MHSSQVYLSTSQVYPCTSQMATLYLSMNTLDLSMDTLDTFDMCMKLCNIFWGKLCYFYFNHPRGMFLSPNSIAVDDLEYYEMI